MRINRLLFQAKQALLLRIPAIKMRSDPGLQVGNALLKSAEWLRTENPILWPLTAVDVPLRVVVADCFFFGDIVCIACDSRAFGRREVWSL